MPHRPIVLILLLQACAAAPPAPAPESTSAASGNETAPAPAQDLGARLPNGRAPADVVYTSGQPSEEDLAAAKEAGVTTVVNLRPTAEQPFDERAAVEGLGLRYVHIPVAGAAGLTEDNARALDEALQGPGPYLVHCGSGNRAGALFGLRAAVLEGADADSAVEIGKQHGMTGLESALRQFVRERQPAAN